MSFDKYCNDEPLAFAFAVLALQGAAPGRLNVVVAGSVAAYGNLLVLRGCRLLPTLASATRGTR